MRMFVRCSYPIPALRQSRSVTGGACPRVETRRPPSSVRVPAIPGADGPPPLRARPGLSSSVRWISRRRRPPPCRTRPSTRLSFPDIAHQQTRELLVCAKSELPLPAGRYAFHEMLCDEAGCDCRRVFFYVVSNFRPGPQAVIAWG
jgi:hypothetical protein